MKKLKYLFVAMITITVFASCTEEALNDDSDMSVDKKENVRPGNQG